MIRQPRNFCTKITWQTLGSCLYERKMCFLAGNVDCEQVCTVDKNPLASFQQTCLSYGAVATSAWQPLMRSRFSQLTHRVTSSAEECHNVHIQRVWLQGFKRRKSKSSKSKFMCFHTSNTPRKNSRNKNSTVRLRSCRISVFSDFYESVFQFYRCSDNS